MSSFQKVEEDSVNILVALLTIMRTSNHLSIVTLDMDLDDMSDLNTIILFMFLKFEIFTNALLNLINHQPDIDKIFLSKKNPYGAKYQILINKREKVGSKHCNDLKVFIEF